MTCGERIVIVRGGSTVYVLAAQGAMVEKKTLPMGRSGMLRPHVEGRVADVEIHLDGQIYVR